MAEGKDEELGIPAESREQPMAPLLTSKRESRGGSLGAVAYLRAESVTMEPNLSFRLRPTRRPWQRFDCPPGRLMAIRGDLSSREPEFGAS